MTAFEWYEGIHCSDVAVEFKAKLDPKGAAKIITNRISLEALDDFFGAEKEPFASSEDRYKAAFKKYRPEIITLALEAIRRGKTNDTGGGDITSEWLVEIGFQSHNR